MHMTDTRITHTIRFLGIHFGRVLGVRFYLNTYPLRGDEVFDAFMALSPIAKAADAASIAIYARPIVETEAVDERSAFGSVVTLRPDLNGLDLMLLIAAAEEFFGISPTDEAEDILEIDLQPILERMAKPVGERGQSWR